MAESGARSDLIRLLRPLDAIAVENTVGVGTPDVQYIGGWIEMKWLRAWPKRPETPVRLDHPLLPSQKVWIKRRVRAGGTVWVMLRSRREWLLFDGMVAREHLGAATRAELSQLARRHWTNGLIAEELIGILKDESRLRRLT